MAGVIRTCTHAGAAADTGLVVHDHGPLVGLVGGSGGAGFHAGCVIAVHAHGQHIALSGVCALSVFHRVHCIVVDAGPCAVSHLTGGDTGVAADAAVQVQYHAVLAHRFSLLVFIMYFMIHVVVAYYNMLCARSQGPIMECYQKKNIKRSSCCSLVLSVSVCYTPLCLMILKTCKVKAPFASKLASDL